MIATVMELVVSTLDLQVRNMDLQTGTSGSWGQESEGSPQVEVRQACHRFDTGPYLEVRCTCNWLYNCSHSPLIRPLCGVCLLIFGLEVESLPSHKYPGPPSTIWGSRSGCNPNNSGTAYSGGPCEMFPHLWNSNLVHP